MVDLFSLWAMLPISFILGASYGQYLMTGIDRLLKKEKILVIEWRNLQWDRNSPKSHCFNCGYFIEKKDTLPLYGYLKLKGKCRYCGVRIPMRYPLVELGTGLLVTLTVLLLGTWFFCVLLSLTVFMALAFWLSDIGKILNKRKVGS